MELQDEPWVVRGKQERQAVDGNSTDSRDTAEIPELKARVSPAVGSDPVREGVGPKRKVLKLMEAPCQAGNGESNGGGELMDLGEFSPGISRRGKDAAKKPGTNARGRKRNSPNGAVLPRGSENGRRAAGNALLSAYNLNQVCDPLDQEHKKNCREKPFCWLKIGEKEHLDGTYLNRKLDQLEKKSWYLRLDERKDLPSIGLMNPSQLCYMSGALQLLFSIPLFRLRLYKWNPAEDATETCSLLLHESDTSEGPTSFAGILIRTFIFMEHSTRMFIEPKSFVESLRLNPDEQQDPHEFLLLVFESLTRSLSGQSDKELNDLVQNIFRGCKAVTFQCSTCKNVWPGEDWFFTFTVNLIDEASPPNAAPAKRQKKNSGNSTAAENKHLFEAIQSAMATEYLTDANCGHCNEKRTVERSYKLKAPLSPVFLIEVSRCAYDSTGSTKKKVRVPLTFDDSLDLSSYVDGADGPINYSLHGVLLHKGTSADEGHYILHIKDGATERWVKYDDASVEFEDHPSFDENKPADKKKKKEAPKTFVSKDCYLLVYVRADDIKASKVVDPGSAVWALKYVEEDEKDARSSRNAFDEFKARIEARVSEKMRLVKDAYNMGHVRLRGGRLEDLNGLEFLPTDCFAWWMHEWPEVISNEKEWKDVGATGKFKPKPSYEASALLCPHERISLGQIAHVKCVPERLATAVREAFDVTLSLAAEESICNECVTNREKVDELKAVLEVEAVELASALKAGPPADTEAAFWLGKASLRDWKKMFLSAHEPSASKKLRKDSGSSNGHDREETGFNRDIACPHGNLILEEKPRLLVSESVWNRLRSRFPACPEFSRNTEPCGRCIEDKCSKAEEAAKRKDKAKDMKSVIGSIIARKRSPPAGCGRMMLLPTEFVESLSRFIRKPENEPNRVIGLDSLLCEHGKLKYSAACDYLENDVFHLVTPDEVECLKEIYEVESEIWASPPPGWQGGSDLKDWTFDVERCEGCWAKEVELNTGEKFAVITLKRLELSSAALHLILSKLEENRALNVDAIYEAVQHQDNAVKEEVEDVLNQLTADLCKSRSGRSRRATKKGADEMSLRVQLKESLDVVQKRVSAKLSIPVSEQTLMLGIKHLDGSDLKLVQHGIDGDCRIVVLYDKKIFGSDVTSTGPRAPEKGFEGTKLAH